MATTIDDTFNPAALSNNTSSNASSTKNLTGGANSIIKPIKTIQNYPRIDLEPLYTDLKSCIAHGWIVYHDALTRFIRGEISSSEFAYLTDDFVYATPTAEHAHNSLICAIIYNTGRDAPDPGLASWVSAASEKPTGASMGKPTITSDAAEQRLKTEIMALPARDRRRLKGIVIDKVDDDSILSNTNNSNINLANRRGGALHTYEDHYQASRIKAPETAPTTSAGLTKTNWELEIKKRYAQPLFAETLEFPDPQAIFARMVPICYEESVGAGASMLCAEMVANAAEVFLKGFLGDIFNRTRVNGPRYENGAGGGVMTASHRRQVHREEAEVKAGRLARNRDDNLLPCESAQAKARRPIAMTDIKLASKVGPTLWNGMPVIGMQVNEASTEQDYDDWMAEKRGRNGANVTSSFGGAASSSSSAAAVVTTVDSKKTNGDGVGIIGGAGDVGVTNNMDEDDYGWEGTGSAEREALGSLLEDCLAIRA